MELFRCEFEFGCEFKVELLLLLLMLLLLLFEVPNDEVVEFEGEIVPEARQ